MIFDNDNIKEVLLKTIPLHGKTTGEDTFQNFYASLLEMNVPIHKLVSVTTDDIPAMTSENVCLTELCKKDPTLPDFFSYQCYSTARSVYRSDQLSTCDMNIVQKIVNLICARPLQHGLLTHLSDKIDAHYGDLIFHTGVRWLSRGKILFTFQELLPAIMEFLQDRGDLPPQLKDSQSLLDLAFLTDLTVKLNDLNTELQGKKKKKDHH